LKLGDVVSKLTQGLIRTAPLRGEMREGIWGIVRSAIFCVVSDSSLISSGKKGKRAHDPDG